MNLLVIFILDKCYHVSIFKYAQTQDLLGPNQAYFQQEMFLWVIVLLIHHFSKKCERNNTLNLFFIDNEKGIPHFKFAPLEYGYSDVYLHLHKMPYD